MQIHDEVIAKSNGSEEEDSAVVFRQHYPSQIQIQVRDNMLLSLKLTDEWNKNLPNKYSEERLDNVWMEKVFKVMDDELIVVKKNTFSFLSSVLSSLSGWIISWLM